MLKTAHGLNCAARFVRAISSDSKDNKNSRYGPPPNYLANQIRDWPKSSHQESNIFSGTPPQRPPLPEGSTGPENHLIHSIPTHLRADAKVLNLQSRYGPRLPGLHEKKDVWEMLKQDLKGVDVYEMVPRDIDVLIVGGGAIGCAIAYWLRSACEVSVMVVERDSIRSQCATALSVGGLRQQFSEPENIQMSLFGAEFLRSIREHLSVFDLDPPDVSFMPHGFLFLASEHGAEQLLLNHQVQKECGAKVELLTANHIKSRWPWLNVDDIELGSFGTDNEGWFDPFLLLNALKRKAISLGALFVKGEAVDFEYNANNHGTNSDEFVLSALQVLLPDGNVQPISFSTCVNAAGPWAGQLAAKAGLGTWADNVPLPVEPRLQHNFVVRKNWSNKISSPSLDMPLIVDSLGLALRREGFHGDFLVYADRIAGQQLHNSNEQKNSEDLEVDYEFFQSRLWPMLAHRVPCMEAIKVCNAWAGYYDYNTVDQNLIIGRHPYHHNFILANGSSGHAVQHSMAIGRAVSELILYNNYKTIDLKRFNYERLYETDKLVFEKKIV